MRWLLRHKSCLPVCEHSADDFNGIDAALVSQCFAYEEYAFVLHVYGAVDICYRDR